MGALMSKKEQDKLNDDINKKLHKDGKKLKSEIKLLLLGTGESGKSTFAKQLKILHMDGFNKDELAHYKRVLQANVLSGVSALLDNASKFGYTVNESLKITSEEYIGIDSATPITADMVSIIKQIWADPAIQQTLERKSEFQLNGCVPYVLNNVDRIADANSPPTHEDIIQSRIRTTGIVELIFELEHVNFRVLDVGGQRSERRKWIHCFESVTAVLFCVALSEYDEKLVEDTKTNRMMEALTLFDEIGNHTCFKESAIILFLNKSDLFKEKVQRVPLNVCFPEYKGANNFEEGAKFVEQKFMSKVKDPEKLVYSHFTCATDTQNVKLVFDVVRSIVVETNLRNMKF
eukprot:TRINITY_DN17332_c0_g1_i1.p1 TRINITY_DN17332_c0_g1~~TRINITY_DN17332_c0_g1_i1.p1  ORF type:complete len:347 (+),score=60.12 TRINITY_DN17332_c0_g1_i1:150-1190(+)